MQEIREGRGAGPLKDHVLLDLTHLPASVFEEKLPYITTLCETLKHLDPRKDMIPVVPTVHYSMAASPPTSHSQVLRVGRDGEDVAVPRLMAIGEAACNSCHGANRLGCNSLLDLVVFGKDAATGQRITSNMKRTVPPRPRRRSTPPSPGSTRCAPARAPSRPPNYAAHSSIR